MFDETFDCNHVQYYPLYAIIQLIGYNIPLNSLILGRYLGTYVIDIPKYVNFRFKTSGEFGTYAVLPSNMSNETFDCNYVL